MNVFTTEGRMNRLKYLGLMLITAIPVCVLSAIGDSGGGIFSILALLTSLLFIFPVSQRFHDLNLSGWYTVFIFIPIIGLIPGLILLFWPSTKGSNKYGDSPVQRDPPEETRTVDRRSVAEKLEELRSLYERGLLDESVYKQKQPQLLKDL